jgi:hypothetical protein
MATEFQVVLEDAPGSLAQLGDVLGNARVNIEAIHGKSREGKGFVEFIPDNIDRTVRALQAAGIAFTTREVVIVRVLDEPGALGEVALVMARAEINIDSVYVTTRGFVVLGVDDLSGAIHVAGSLAVMLQE